MTTTHIDARMLAVDQGRLAVRGLAARQQQRIAAVAHERLRAQHEAQIERVAASESETGPLTCRLIKEASMAFAVRQDTASAIALCSIRCGLP